MASGIQLAPLSVSRSILCKWEQEQSQEISKIKSPKKNELYFPILMQQNAVQTWGTMN